MCALLQMMIYFNIFNAFHFAILGSIPLFKDNKEKSIIKFHDSDRANIYCSFKSRACYLLHVADTHTQKTAAV
jgi:hypothetical protein